MEVLAVIAEEVADYFIVDLKVADADHEGSGLITSISDVLEDVLDGPGDDAALRVVAVIFEALHSEGFASSGLAVGHDGGIEALEGRLHGMAGSVVIDFLLSVVLVVDKVEGEGVHGVAVGVVEIIFELIRVHEVDIVVLVEADFAMVGRNLDGGDEAAVDDFALEGGTNADDNFEIVV